MDEKKCFFIFNTLLSLIFKASCNFLLTSDPSPLEGVSVCPGSIHLHCIASNVNVDAVRWFFSRNTMNSMVFADNAFENNEILPKSIRLVEMIPGVEVILAKTSISDDKYIGYESTLTVNLSAFNERELSFTCGTFSQKSNNISLNFTIAAPPDPLPRQLIPSYNSSYLLISLTAVWKQTHLSHSKRCSSLFVHHVVLNKNGNFEDEEVVGFDQCNELMCSVGFKVASVASSGDLFSISIQSGDVFGHYNEQQLVFSDRINSSIQASLKYSFSEEICASTLRCSYRDEIECMFQYSLDPPRGDPVSPLDVPLNGSLMIPNIKYSTAYNFKITVNISTSLEIQLQGSFMTILAVDYLTSSNKGVLSVGVSLFLTTTPLLIILLLYSWRIYRQVPKLFQVGLVISVVVTTVAFLLSLILWLVVAFVLGLQRDICDLSWQSVRNNLLGCSLCFTLTAFLLVITIGATILSVKYKDKITLFWKKLRKSASTDEPDTTTAGSGFRNQVTDPEHSEMERETKECALPHDQGKCITQARKSPMKKEHEQQCKENIKVTKLHTDMVKRRYEVYYAHGEGNNTNSMPYGNHYFPIQEGEVQKTSFYDLPLEEETPSHKSPWLEKLQRTRQMYDLPREEEDHVDHHPLQMKKSQRSKPMHDLLQNEEARLDVLHHRSEKLLKSRRMYNLPQEEEETRVDPYKSKEQSDLMYDLPRGERSDTKASHSKNHDEEVPCEMTKDRELYYNDSMMSEGETRDYVNSEKEIDAKNKPRNYVNKQMEKRFWPYGAIL